MADHNTKDINYKTLRLTVGAIAFLMPFLTMGFFWWHSAPEYLIPTSISVTYHLGAQDIFVGFLFVVGGFLMAYRGPEGKKGAISFIAGVCAVGIAIFPTSVDLDWIAEDQIRFDPDVCIVTTQDNKCITASLFKPDPRDTFADTDAPKFQIIPAIHYGCAIILIGTLIYFTYSFHQRACGKLIECKLYPLPHVKRRILIYRVCLVAMGLSFVFAAYAVYRERFGSGLPPDDPTVFIVELVCLLAFGVSWMVASKKLPKLKEPDEIEREADRVMDVQHAD